MIYWGRNIKTGTVTHTELRLLVPALPAAGVPSWTLLPDPNRTKGSNWIPEIRIRLRNAWNTWNYFKREKWRKNLPKLSNEKLVMDRIKLLGKPADMSHKEKWNSRRKGEREGKWRSWETCRAFLERFLVSWFKCKRPFWGTHGSHQHHKCTWVVVMTKRWTDACEHSWKSVLPGHLSWGWTQGLGMWPILVSEPKESVVENTKNSPLTHFRGKYTKPPKA